MECLREVIVEREGCRSSKASLDVPMSFSPMSACLEILDRLITMENVATDKDRPLTSIRGVSGTDRMNKQTNPYEMSRHFNLLAIRVRLVSGFYDSDGGRDYDPPCFICGKMQQTESNPGLLCEDCPCCAHIRCIGLDDGKCVKMGKQKKDNRRRKKNSKFIR
jgi:hypothetical protein|tara:strand:- start:67 stop:555 length:489 start_codon:yes stop_codon:yes gene_type:complete